MSRLCLLFIIIQVIYVTSTQEVVRRVPQGFVGMRGKKYIDSQEMEHFYKRKPQFFIGVKGKKALFDYLGHDSLDKRVPMGFVGMRGKKENMYPLNLYPDYAYVPKIGGSLIGQIGYSANNDMTSSDFRDSGLKHGLPKYLPKAILSSNSLSDEQSAERITNEVDKRSSDISRLLALHCPKIKQPYPLYLADVYNCLSKSQESLSGRIDYLTNGDPERSNEIQLSILEELLSKYLRNYEEPHISQRPEDNSDVISDEQATEHLTGDIEKRAVNVHQFYEGSDEKMIQNKRPYDSALRGKFVGVRGKRALKNNGVQEIKFLLGQGGPWPKRKAQMGFIGMRGKKWNNESPVGITTPN